MTFIISYVIINTTKEEKNRKNKTKRIGGTVQRKHKLSSGTNFYMTRKYKNYKTNDDNRGYYQK